MYLNSKATAALIGRSIFTLQRARYDRPDLDMPPACRVGSRGVGYPLADLLRWARRRREHLHWDDLPASYALPAAQAHADAGLPLPAALAAAVGRVPLSADHT
jgi:hypothetical protein